MFWSYTGVKTQSKEIQVSGNIETTTVGVGFKIAGHVAQRKVDEGESIRQGQIIAELETNDLQLDVAGAEAQLLAAKAALAELMNGSRPQEVMAAQASARSAEADRENAGAIYHRMEQLFDHHAISLQDRDQSKAAYAMASARADEMAQRLSAVVEGPRQEEISLAAAKVEQARYRLELARTKLAYAQIVAPIDGVVLSKQVEAGEYVALGTPIVTLGDLDRVWLKAYIAEPDLGRIQLGQAVAVKTDTYPDKIYEGRISFISSEAEFTPKNIQTAEERVKLVYRIKIDLDNAGRELKPGMPADAVITIGGV